MHRHQQNFYVPISIHAPTKGATVPLHLNPLLLSYFNPRSHEGSDALVHSKKLMIALFQSTLPRRERRLFSIYIVNIKMISIHAPTKGATAHYFATGIPTSISIHAPTKGATTEPPAIRRTRIISIHAPTKGATYNRCLRFLRHAHFNPRSHEGSDPRH